jgi:hypothetical protein
MRDSHDDLERTRAARALPLQLGIRDLSRGRLGVARVWRRSRPVAHASGPQVRLSDQTAWVRAASMKMWTFPAGAGTTRYLVAAHLDALSTVALVASEGFAVARWRAGPEPQLVRGQWISPMSDLRLVLDGRALELDIVAEDQLVETLARRSGWPSQQARVLVG